MRKFTEVSGTARQAIRRNRAPSVLVCASGMNRCRICGAKTAKTTTKQAGNQATSAQAEQIAEGGKQIKPGRHQRYRCHHIRISDLADEKGIGQIVDHGHHLTDDGGDCKRRHRLRHRHFFKKIFFRLFLHNTGLLSVPGMPPESVSLTLAFPEGTSRFACIPFYMHSIRMS